MMNSIDKNRLRALMERYNYNEFNILNESFQSSTLARLIDINKRDHIGLSGEKEEALSPIGANFLMAFPIHWDKVPEKNVKLVVNPRVKEHSPRQEEKFDKNLNKYSWAKNDDEKTNFKLSSYVSTGAKDDDAYDLFVKYSGRLKREIDYLTKIKDESERGTFNGWDLRVLSKYKKGAKPIVEDITTLKKAYDVLFWMTLPSISKERADIIANYDPNELKNLNRSIGEDRFISIIDDAKKYLKDNDGKTPNAVMRTRTDYLDDFGSIRDLKYPKVDVLLDILANDKKYIDESSIGKLKKEYVDRFKNDYITTQRRITWMINKIKSLGLEKSDTEFVKDSENPNKYNNEMISLYKGLIAKGVGKNSEVGDLLQLYINAESAGDNAKTKMKTYIDTILSGFSSDSDNDDNYKIAVLTDVKFKILYVVSNLKLDDVGFEPTSVLYGWEEGMSPSVYETPISISDEKETKTHEVKYDFTNPIDINYIKEDNRVRCAFFVTGRTNNSEVLKTTKDIEKLNAKLKKVISGDDKALSSTDFDTNGIESKDMHDVKALFDKYDLPYQIKDGKLYCEVTGGNALEDNNLVRVLGIIGQNKLDKGLVKKYLDDIRSATIESKIFSDIKKYSKDDFDEYYKDKLNSLDFAIKGKKIPYKSWLKNSAILKDANGNPLFSDSSDSFEKRKYYDEVYVGADIYNTITGNIKSTKMDLEDYVTAHNKYVRLYLKTTSNFGGGDDIRYTQALKKARELAGNTPERVANKERQFKKSPLANLDIDKNDPKNKEINSFITGTSADINYIESTSPKSKKGGKWYDIYDTVIKTTPELDIPDIPQFYSRFILRITNILRAYQNLVKRYPDKLDVFKDREMQIKDGYANMVDNINSILGELEPDMLQRMGKVKESNEYTERIADAISNYAELLEDARVEIDKIKAE